MHKFWVFLLGALTAIIIVQLSKTCILSSNSDHLNILARQAARWTLAAEQDRSPIIALLHANYGAGYLWAMSDIATTEQIEAATKINYQKFRKRIVSVQDKITKGIVQQYPQFAGEADHYLSQIAGKA